MGSGRRSNTVIRRKSNERSDSKDKLVGGRITDNNVHIEAKDLSQPVVIKRPSIIREATSKSIRD